MTESLPLQLHLDTDDDTDTNHANTGRYRPPRPSALPARKSIFPGAGGGGRSRRRSSARFLSIGGGRRNNDDTESLGKMYKQAIKMNAENRINASNSWNFTLIENIDKFLTEEDEEEDVGEDGGTATTTDSPNTRDHGGGGTNKRVNFTKASCTLDASVKIYSYRVDDVHLTSYRVLENLHRTDGDKQKQKNRTPQDDAEDDDDGTANGGRTNPGQRSKSNISTVESNLANINLNKLDAAFDIDPLFHKMSKTFDEGGAKGLLLVNLGTSGKGCDIVFDSGLVEDDDGEEEKTGDPDPDTTEPTTTMIDISSLATKLESLLAGQTVYSLPLVPQLAGLRAEYSNLEQEGFVDHTDVPISRNRRFAPDPEEENEADRSIHQDVLERSRASMGRSFLGDDDEEDNDNGPPMQVDTGFAADDYGGFDDGDDDDFDAFMAADDDAQRYSSLSFGGTSPIEREGASTTAVLLDAISSGQVLGDSEYEFFDAQELSHMAANAWAGSAHWKPVAHLHKPKATTTAKPTEKKTRSTKAAKERAFVDLSQTPDLSDILRKPPKAKSRRANDPLQLSSASITKYTKNENLLPPDVGIRPNVLSSLFLRPNAFVKPNAVASSTKTVGFAMDQVETFGGNDWDDGSFGGDDDDDGPGFAMADSDGENEDDFVVEELEGIRKVDKVSVSYATIAKKVDVKRLKRDLWTELESYFEANKEKDDAEEDDDDKEEEIPSTPTGVDPSGPLSFQETVRAMEASKTQVDVTLPFYFICILHLANEKGLRLDSTGLEDFEIHNGDGTGSVF